MSRTSDRRSTVKSMRYCHPSQASNPRRLARTGTSTPPVQSSPLRTRIAPTPIHTGVVDVLVRTKRPAKHGQIHLPPIDSSSFRLLEISSCHWSWLGLWASPPALKTGEARSNPSTAHRLLEISSCHWSWLGLWTSSSAQSAGEARSIKANPVTETSPVPYPHLVAMVSDRWSTHAPDTYHPSLNFQLSTLNFQ